MSVNFTGRPETGGFRGVRGLRQCYSVGRDVIRNVFGRIAYLLCRVTNLVGCIGYGSILGDFRSTHLVKGNKAADKHQREEDQKDPFTGTTATWLA